MVYLSVAYPERFRLLPPRATAVYVLLGYDSRISGRAPNQGNYPAIFRKKFACPLRL